jgi:hypothetical protein
MQLKRLSMTRAGTPNKEDNMADFTITEIEQAIQQRMNLLATNDVQCQRWMGQLDVLRNLENSDEETPTLEVVTDDASEAG